MTKSILETIARWGYRYRHTQKDARGLFLHPEQVGDVSALAGRDAWMECKRDRNIWGALVSQPDGATMFDKLLYGGVEIVEDEKVPRGSVIFKVDGEEVGRITDLNVEA